MSTVNGITTIVNNSQTLVGSSSGITWDNSLAIDKTLIEYIDLLYQIMGIDITYDRWKKLSSSEKIQLVRDIKLKKIIEE